MARISGRPERRRHEYRLFGLDLASDYELASRLEPARGPADIELSVAAEPPFAAPLGDPLYESPLLDEAGDSLSRLYRPRQGEVLRFGDAVDFYLGAGRIDCHLRRPEAAHLVEIRLLGPVLAYWLETLGICALHASAVVVDGRAVIFLAGHQGGKTGLAAAMMRGGAPLLTDDLLPVEARPDGLLARAGYPQMRMWPDQLAAFVDGWRELPLAHPGLDKRRLPVGAGGFGAFHGAAVPPAVVYLPERLARDDAGGEVRIAPVRPRDALIELLRGSFSPFIVEAVGLQARRLETLGRLAREVPVRRLVHPSGQPVLERVRLAVLEDLAALRGGAAGS